MASYADIKVKVAELINYSLSDIAETICDLEADLEDKNSEIEALAEKLARARAE